MSEQQMNIAQVLEFKNSSITINEMLSIAKKANTPRAIGIISIIEYMAANGESADKILKTIIGLSKIKLKECYFEDNQTCTPIQNNSNETGE